ncbi:hypothetical protein VAR608DRAFT_1107 [Variovorax sp. HW608]|uniref:YciI family protein n=1 Tax=Variovorax sp. HW608 TaxID=1034889 RepID=UPI00081FC1DD|nr:YciI family protein [Variovorax sp. HW608]SCK16530.1 hypothetical protein VAR608DRAFT_1107 [Variovorax sp. HW608]
MSTEAASELLADMLNKRLYVALRTPRDAARMGELLESHLRWAVAAERRGELFASGPFVGEGAAPGSLGGLSVLRAASEEEARAILAADPFVAEGAVSIEVRCWLLMEGGFTLNVHLSDQSCRLL